MPLAGRPPGRRSRGRAVEELWCAPWVLGSAGVLSASRYHQPAGMLRQIEVNSAGSRW